MAHIEEMKLSCPTMNFIPVMSFWSLAYRYVRKSKIEEKNLCNFLVELIELLFLRYCANMLWPESE